jgi:hypothetical protein
MKKEPQNTNTKEAIASNNMLAECLTGWQRIGNYEHEYNSNGYTGRYRCYQGRMANGIHPSWDKNGVETVS